MTFLDLSDEALMLALCVRPENLEEPARWCREIRALARAINEGPKTTEEAEELMRIGDRLRDEALSE